MDITVKSEPIESEMDIKEEIEPIIANDIEGEIAAIVKGDIKVEKELIIESDWLPTKVEDEANEYYQECVNECNQNDSEAVVENGSGYEIYIIETLDESDNADSDSEDDYAESDEHDSGENDDNIVEIDFEESADREESLESTPLYQLQLDKWILDNFISRECPVCNEKLPNYSELQKHIILSHKESIEESESNYYFSSDNCAICKKCNQQFTTQYSRYVHTKQHSELTSKSHTIYNCKMCNFNSKRMHVQKHVLKKHSDVVKEFKPSNSIKKLKCPLCSYTYLKRLHLGYHFMDKHPEEYNGKLIYNCPLCSYDYFEEKEHFLLHLIEHHNLNSWKVLNYRKVFEDKDYFACAKCNRLFFQNDTCKLLSHFLNHETKFVWSCKFCYKRFSFKTSPFSHMCRKVIRYYKTPNETAEDPINTECRMKTLEEFEEHITHVCPFCNNEFNKMLKWLHHLKKYHGIDTQINAHSFQHLPYKPYKCLLCLKMLNTFKMAMDHVLKRCIDDDSVLKIQCSICNFQHNDLTSILKHNENEHNYFENFFIKESDNSTMTCKVCHNKYVQNGNKSFFLHLHNHFDEKTFKCKLCLRSYPTLKSISEHLLQSHNYKLFNKQSIETESAKTSDLINSKTHNIKNFRELTKFVSYVCPECNEYMTTKTNWNTHITTHHNFFNESNLYIKDADGSLKCPTCSITLGRMSYQQRNHKLIHMPHKSFMCNLCHRRYVSIDSMYNHYRRRHFAQGTFKCYICPVILQTEYQRSEHLKEMHPLKEWPNKMCLLCYKTFTTNQKLKKHCMVIDNGNNFSYICYICGSKLLSLRVFEAHMDTHRTNGDTKEKLRYDTTFRSASNSIQSNDTSDIDETETEKNRKIKEKIIEDISPQCSSANDQSKDTTNRIEILNESHTTVHDFEEFTSCETKEEMIDDVTLQCESTTAERVNKKKTINVRNEFDEFISYACPECNEGMTTQDLWHSHIRTQHNFFDKSNLYIKETDESLKCPICRIRVSSGQQLQERHKLTHMPYKSFICNICYVRYSSLGAIYVHFRQKHFAHGKFECPICYMVLQTMHQRMEHLKNIHNRNEWPDKMCSICYQMYASKIALKHHMATHNADRFKYTCSLCGPTCYAGSVRSHIEMHKIRGDSNVEISHIMPSQLALQNSQSKPTGIDIVPEFELLNKRKYITKSSETKRKRIGSE